MSKKGVNERESGVYSIKIWIRSRHFIINSNFGLTVCFVCSIIRRRIRVSVELRIGEEIEISQKLTCSFIVNRAPLL
jgi:hypothetical protein